MAAGPDKARVIAVLAGRGQKPIGLHVGLACIPLWRDALINIEIVADAMGPLAGREDLRDV